MMNVVYLILIFLDRMKEISSDERLMRSSCCRCLDDRTPLFLSTVMVVFQCVTTSNTRVIVGTTCF